MVLDGVFKITEIQMQGQIKKQNVLNLLCDEEWNNCHTIALWWIAIRNARSQVSTISKVWKNQTQIPEIVAHLKEIGWIEKEAEQWV